MLKNIQNYLLLNHPLLWNTKIIPFSILLIFINMIFFFIGFKNGEIDFSQTNNNYFYDSAEPILTFVGGLISALIIIIWLVYYFKNNAFKSFYPKNTFGLFKELVLIFVIGFLTTTFSVCYLFAKEVRVRSYFSENEAKKRCEILSMGSVFLDGAFDVSYHDVINPQGDTIKEPKNYSQFKGKKYRVNSLINKNIENFQFFDNIQDSLLKVRVRSWLYNNDRAAVKSLFKNYLNIAKEHKLKANIDENKWLDLVYNPSEFEEVNIVGKHNFVNAYNNNYSEINNDYSEVLDVNGNKIRNDNFDYLNKYRVQRNGYTDVAFKHYVPAANLNYAYTNIAKTWVNPSINWLTLLFPLYFAFGFSLLVFGFRVTSGRNWLIAGVSLGLIAIVFGIISAIFSTEKVFLTLVDLLIVLLFVYFIFIANKKREKGISGIVINALLWLIGFFIPLNYFLLQEFLKFKYSSIYYTDVTIIKLNQQDLKIKNLINFIDDNVDLMFILNLIFMFLFMLFITTKIKKWRGIPEN